MSLTKMTNEFTSFLFWDPLKELPPRNGSRGFNVLVLDRRGFPSLRAVSSKSCKPGCRPYGPEAIPAKCRDKNIPPIKGS